jgi:hypothetical protein
MGGGFVTYNRDCEVVFIPDFGGDGERCAYLL